MAIYHFSAKPISRSKGQSAVACAAYRSAERLQDAYYGKLRDYTRKQDVIYTEILLPEGAPLWMSDRERLWNAVEESEKRKDAQLAREFDIALPRELTLEQNIALAREFVQAAFVKEGMVADVCVHNDVMPNGERQPHVHVMLTLREVSEAGFGQKVRAWNAKSKLLLWREAWAESANRHLALHGHDLRIDHRTLAAQGIDLEPQHKIGASVAKERLARLADHQRIARENGEKLLKQPEIALDALSQQQSTFTHQDIARFVDRHTEDAAQFALVYAKVKGCDALVFLGKDSQGRERFTTKEMLSIEQAMMGCAEGLSERVGHGIGEGSFGRSKSLPSLTDEQRLAFDHLVRLGDLRCVVGYAGSGKSYLLGAAREVWESEGYRVLGATLSGIAAENLRSGSGIETRTLASRFYYWDKGEQLLTSQDVLVIDEAGMIGSRQMAQALGQAAKGGAKVVLVGDSEQLQAISAGAAFRAIAERVGYVALTDIRRQQVDWQKAATRELATGQTSAALRRYDEAGHLHGFETQAFAQKALIEQWNDSCIQHPHESHIILTYLRKEVQELNDRARQCLRERGELGTDRCFQTERGERLFAVQDRVYFLKNDRSLGVMNGSLGTVVGMQGSQLQIRLDPDDRASPVSSRAIWVDTEQYPHVAHGYAATVHKAQGVTVDRSYVLASSHLDRHATYVALSRHRKRLDIFYSDEVFAKKQDLFNTLSRERGKDVTLDYGEAASQFADRRHIDSPSEAGLVEDRFASRTTPPSHADREAALDAFKARYEQQHSERAHLPPEVSLDGLLKRYVEMQLEQTRLVNEMHSSGLSDDRSLRRACSAKALAHSKALERFASDALKQPEVRALADKVMSQMGLPRIGEKGGYQGMLERFHQGIVSDEDRQILMKTLYQKARSASKSLFLDQSRDRGGGRSR